MNNETCLEYGYELKTSFRGLLGLIEGELWRKDFEEAGYYLLSFRFRTKCAEDARFIRLSITRAYNYVSTPFEWACSDVIQHALCHEAAESAPQFFVHPTHILGALDIPDVAERSAMDAEKAHQEDELKGRWFKESLVSEAWGRGWQRQKTTTD